MLKKGKAPKPFRRTKKSRLGLYTAALMFGLVGFFIYVVEQSQPHVDGTEISMDTLVRDAEAGRIIRATILDYDSFVVGEREVDGARQEFNVPYLKELSTRDLVVELLTNNDVDTRIDQQNGKRRLRMLSIVIPGVILSIFFLYMIVSHRRGTGLFNLKSGARSVRPRGPSKVRFTDVAGQEKAVTELKEVRDFLAHPERFAGLGATVPKGILLFGPPGCGKTLLAQAVAGEAGAAFFSISGSDFVEMYVGVGAARVRDLFREARENAPAIIFIDELDSVGRRRGGGPTANQGSGEEHQQALNQILAEMDGFNSKDGVIVMAATNRPDVLDPALLRPGRFDRTIGLERPKEHERLEILKLHARNKKVDPRASLQSIAAQAIGLSGADLANVMNEAALLAARARKPVITQVELDAALTRILEAPELQRRLSMRDRNFGRTTGPQSLVTFDDVAGIDEVLDELSEIRQYLADPERFLKLGARPPRGFLLVGPPGCGKTLLAQALAVEANAAFFAVGGAQFVEVYAGEGAARVRDLFAEAKSAAPAIVFLDEIDAVGARRGSAADAGREREQTLNQILIELDGFDARSGVTVIAATNRPEILDEALIRPGRFDRTVTLGLPDRAARREILKVHSRGKVLGSDVDLDAIAEITQGFSGADLANVMNEGALLAARYELPAVGMSALEEAVDRVGVGIARERELSAEDRTMTAYHEIGHAMVGLALPGARTPRKISIVSRGQALGATRHVDVFDRTIMPKSVLIDQMAGMLGGRAAEELVFGEPGSGSADDLRQVADIARQMVCEFGMSPVLGHLSYSGSGNGSRYSEEVARAIDLEAKRFVDEAYERARSVLAASRQVLDRAAAELMRTETMSGEEFAALVGPLPGANGGSGGSSARRSRRSPATAKSV